jgi:phosphoglycolate phosphatase-like HAD superfamily hydrolase
MTAPVETDIAAWLVALDIDGTVLHGDGSISDVVIGQVRRLDAAGHQVMLATGRSSVATIPVVEQLGITPPVLSPRERRDRGCRSTVSEQRCHSRQTRAVAFYTMLTSPDPRSASMKRSNANGEMS